MSECVVRIGMPTNCAKCDLHYICSESRGFHGFDAIREMMRLDTVNDKREDEHCLFICSLPEGHGRLVDAEILRAKLIEHIAETNGFGNAFNETPTIVPAERSEICLD